MRATLSRMPVTHACLLAPSLPLRCEVSEEAYAAQVKQHAR
jgi:hypothetical protein